MRILLIVNATASSVTPRMRVVIQKALGADHDLEVAETSRRGHATRLARSAAIDGYDVVVVLAGDGTLNEAANGLAGSQTALAPLPGGSTNVFAQSIGVTVEAIDATAQLLQSLERKSFHRIGLGAADGRRFLFHAGIGFDAAVVRQVERRSTSPAIKRYAAHPMFLFAAFDAWFRHYDHSRPRFDIEIPGEEPIQGSIFAILSNQSPYTYLGARPIVAEPDASLDRPLFVTAFRARRALTFLRCAASTLGSGRTLRRHRSMAHRADVTEMTIVGHGPFPWQADGDYMGDVERLHVVWEPDALTLVEPSVS